MPHLIRVLYLPKIYINNILEVKRYRLLDISVKSLYPSLIRVLYLLNNYINNMLEAKVLTAGYYN